MTVTYSQTGWAAASPARAAATETFSDEVLIRRIANGDQLAMRTLFSRHRLAIYRWLLRLVDDEALADDLLSDVFLDVWRKATSFERRSSVSTWLLAIARHKALAAVAATLNSTPNLRPRSQTLRTTRSLSYRRKTEKNCCAIPWLGYRRSTARSSTSPTIMANPSRRSPRSSASTRPR